MTITGERNATYGVIEQISGSAPRGLWRRRSRVISITFYQATSTTITITIIIITGHHRHHSHARRRRLIATVLGITQAALEIQARKKPQIQRAKMRRDATFFSIYYICKFVLKACNVQTEKTIHVQTKWHFMHKFQTDKQIRQAVRRQDNYSSRCRGKNEEEKRRAGCLCMCVWCT